MWSYCVPLGVKPNASTITWGTKRDVDIEFVRCFAGHFEVGVVVVVVNVVACAGGSTLYDL